MLIYYSLLNKLTGSGPLAVSHVLIFSIFVWSFEFVKTVNSAQDLYIEVLLALLVCDFGLGQSLIILVGCILVSDVLVAHGVLEDL